jgi:predicted phage terminase large subunit-like protein
MICENDWSSLMAGALTLPESTWASLRQKLDAEESLYEFLHQAWPIIEPGKIFVPGWHIEAVCEHLQAVTRGQIRNLLITVPPGCTKTTTVCVMWPAWEWITVPETRWLFASYSLPRAQDAAQLCGILLRSKWYRSHWRDRFRLRTAAETELHNDRLGWRKCASVQAGTTGEHGDRLVIDDPHNVKDVESEAVRRETIRWHDHAWHNRVNDPIRSTRVVLGQRTHHEDLIGHLKATGDYEVLSIPEEFEEGSRCTTIIGWSDPREADGELMRPERFGPRQVEEAKRTLGSQAYAAQHQQRPYPKGGALFKRDWWKNRCRYELRGGDAIVRQGKPGVRVLNECSIFVIVDGAASSRSTADHSAITVFAVDGDNDLYVLWVVRGRFEVEQIIPTVEDVCRAWRPDWVGIEASGFQVWFVKEARNRQHFPDIPTVKELKPTDGMKSAVGSGKGKAARANPAIIRAEAGQIFLPYSDDPANPWVAEFEEELYAFTGKEGREDDQADCLAYAVLAIDQLGYGPVLELPPPVFGRRPGPFN